MATADGLRVLIASAGSRRHRRPKYLSRDPYETVNMAAPNEITQLLVEWSNGRQEALDELLPVVYGELRRAAKRSLRRERSNHTLSGTALVNEVYLQLVDQAAVRWQNRAHFFGIAANLMRQILVQHARRHQTAKRGGGQYLLALDEAAVVPTERPVDLVALDDALSNLAERDARKSRIVELRYFGGLSTEETAEVLGISARTVKREWRLAKAWLYHELTSRRP
jgi:RNA polymerase sigma-70 factor (ECF subfamily)